MMMFETSKHVPKTEKRCCVFKNNYKTICKRVKEGDKTDLKTVKNLLAFAQIDWIESGLTFFVCIVRKKNHLVLK